MQRTHARAQRGPSQPGLAAAAGGAGVWRARCRACGRRRPRLAPAAAAPAGGGPSGSGGSGGASTRTLDQTLQWHTVDQPERWRGPAATVLAPGSPAARLTPPWRLLLLSDGSVTRHLELISGRETTVECMQMQTLEGPEAAAAAAAVPPAARRISGPLLQRQSLLRASAGGAPLVYASSWWCAATVGGYLADAARPIWTSLALGQVEVYREILEVYHGDSPALEALLGCAGPFWGRSYFFHHAGRPLTLIHEVFSNALEEQLGPQWRGAGGGGGGGGGGEGLPE